MAIRPLPSERIPAPFRTRKAGTLDLEWNPETYELRVCGVYYRGQYRYFLTIEAFLEWFLTPENNGLELWAHYGGRADFAFIIPALVKAKIQTDGLVNGSAVFAMTITRGRNQYYLRDSFFLTMSSLEEAGHTFAGRGKESCSFYAPLKELIAYNKADNVLLYDVLCNLDDLWGQLGTRLGLTNASTAFSLVRAKYISEVIPTNDVTNAMFRKRALFCSLVAVYCRTVAGALAATGAPYAVGYDQNSAHPRSYTGAMPGAEVDGGKRRPPRFDADGNELLWFVDADITVPSSCNIPPIPMRAATGRIVHPTGSWRALLFEEQVQLLEDCGGTVDKVHWYYTFKVNRDLEAFGRDLFERKKNCKDPGLLAVLKYALNGGGFGKFAECPERMQLVIGEVPARLLYDKSGRPLASAEKIRIISPTISLVPTFRPAPHEHVPMAVITGGRSMVRLERDMIEMERHGSMVLYADTDGFKATLPTDRWEPEVGTGLGEYKLEYPHIAEGHFAGPKFYAIKDVELMQTIVRAKSFPVARYGELLPGSRNKRRGLLIASDETRSIDSMITYEKVGRIIEEWPWEGEPERETEGTIRVQFERMRRIPEMLNSFHSRSEPLEPSSVIVSKEPRAPRPSRCFDRSGFSRPWKVEEING